MIKKKRPKQALCAKLVEFVEWTPRSQNLTFFARLRLVFQIPRRYNARLFIVYYLVHICISDFTKTVTQNKASYFRKKQNEKLTGTKSDNF